MSSDNPPESPKVQAPNPSLANPAIASCISAYDRAYQQSIKTRKGEFEAGRDAGKAFCDAMPPLCGYENIRDFVACIAHAMVIGAMREDHGAKLLYAAQVSLSALRCQPAAPKPKAA